MIPPPVSRSPFWIAAVFTLLLACSSPVPEPSPPNVLFIYVDDLGWRDLGVMGSTYYETPNVDGLASEGMVFTDAYACAPNCAPSRACLLTGMYTPRHGVYTVGSAERGQAADRKLIPVENETNLELDFLTLGEVLQEAGYRTGFIGKWHLGGEGHLPRDQGFDWSLAGDEAGTPASYFYPYKNQTRAIPGLEEGVEGEYLADRLTSEAITFLKEAGVEAEPFFLFLSHYSVHTPLRAKPELTERYREKPASGGHDHPTYAAMVHSVDESVGRLLATLDSLGLAENTVVFFHSDNGGYGPATSMAPLRGSKGMLYEGGIRVPLIVRWPGQVQSGARSDIPVMGTDIYPTILEMAGGTATDGRALDGISLTPLLVDRGEPASRALYWHFPAYLEADASVEGLWRTTPASAVRRGRYKLLHFFEDGRRELYDLISDPSESEDLSADLGQEASELGELLERWWRETRACIPSEFNPLYDPSGDGTG
jgi:arylsulfatase A-like enzyme